MSRWDEQFQALSRGSTASFGADPYEGTIGDEYDDVIGAPGLEVTSSPTPKGPFTFDLSKVPAPLFAALTFAGVALVAATAYSLGEIYERERHEHGLIKVSHVRRKPLLGYAKEREWALREALGRTPSKSNTHVATHREAS